MDEIIARGPSIDQARIDATTEEDIRQQMVEDGEDPDSMLPEMMYPDVLSICWRLKLSREQFADLLGVPIETVRAWETCRFDPAALALVRIIDTEPDVALRALRRVPQPA